jgi:hypothetical protein
VSLAGISGSIPQCTLVNKGLVIDAARDRAGSSPAATSAAEIAQR